MADLPSYPGADTEKDVEPSKRRGIPRPPWWIVIPIAIVVLFVVLHLVGGNPGIHGGAH